ncbi:MAPEG family protein [Limoniibacter endophyticus]|uniref:Membrane protein n=1 Tax=Limoniibacter endophyticus TaxID=1565040 RepID=A0A8J3GI09_9HYPH|nr:MAPEG family protein [Limoniibacter endophyticus]GHC74180.1 membrane protein [Limoniibacter endophyticus]
MENEAALALSPLLVPLLWSVPLLVVHILLQGVTATKELGTDWNAGPRDDDRKASGILAGRAERASLNFRETYPVFIVLALTLAIMGETAGWAIFGAWLWFVCRIIYIPLYLAGIPYIRSLVWVGSLIGLLIMFLTALF